tara:strand:+ start:209 stop:622 length:414 start_codon:yes stop_codon:yes gene_type:complete
MSYAVARQERYVGTKKGKEAATRSKLKYQKKLRSTEAGRIKLKYRKVKCEHGKDVADWWLKQKPMCFICGESVVYEKAPSRKNTRSNANELVIDHNHKIKKFVPRHLLCQRHNLGYGMFQESVEQLQRAIEYKKRYG